MSNTTQLAAIILAAGQGTRMQSTLPKVLHPVAGRSMLGHVLALSEQLCWPRAGWWWLARTCQSCKRRRASRRRTRALRLQAKQLGTADAVKAARSEMDGFTGDVIILYADTPLVRPETLQAMLAARRSGASAVVLGFRPADPSPYGRLVMNADSGLDAIIESKDCTPEQRAIGLLQFRCDGGGWRGAVQPAGRGRQQ